MGDARGHHVEHHDREETRVAEAFERLLHRDKLGHRAQREGGHLRQKRMRRADNVLKLESSRYEKLHGARSQREPLIMLVPLSRPVVIARSLNSWGLTMT